MVVAVGLALGACGGGADQVVATDQVLSSIQMVPAFKEVPFDSPSPAKCPSTSHPFNTMLCSIGNSLNFDADGTTPIDLKALGYSEKEFFQSGKANVYDLDANERAVIRSQNNPYTTRLMVRYPTDPAKFSGRVYIEILNPSNNYDIENTWRRSWQHMIGKGDAYIGITSKSVCVDSLKKFDATRYADLNWKVNGVAENGLFWDMLSQLATQLRQTDAKILGALKPKYVYLTGESQSGRYMNTYLTAFSNRIENAGPDGKPLFDGYLSGVAPMTVLLRSETALPFSSVTTKLFQSTKVPFIAYMSENESRSYDYVKAVGESATNPRAIPYTRRVDSNLTYDKFRLYEFPGTPHADPNSPVLTINSEVIKAGGAKRSNPSYYLTQEHDDLQLTEFVHAMQENLHEWAANGVAAPGASSKWMYYNVSVGANGDALHDPQRDAYGNALGGVRSPMIDVPLHRFYGQGQMGVSSTTGLPTYIPMSWGSMDKLPDATINKLYGNKCSTYLGKFNAAADALVTGRYILKADADTLKAWAVTKGNTVTWGDGNKCN